MGPKVLTAGPSIRFPDQRVLCAGGCIVGRLEGFVEKGIPRRIPKHQPTHLYAGNPMMQIHAVACGEIVERGRAALRISGDINTIRPRCGQWPEDWEIVPRKHRWFSPNASRVPGKRRPNPTGE